MRILETKIDEKEYVKFLKSNDRCDFQQSLEWAQLKNNWIREVILAEDDNKKIIGSLLVLIRKMPIFGNLMYSARGPVCDIHNKQVLTQITEGAKFLAKKYNAIALRLEPDIESNDKIFREIITELGYNIKDDAKSFKEEIQAKNVLRLNLKGKTEEEVFNNFHSKTRYNVRIASKKGVIIKEGTKEDLKVFHKIMVITGKRDGFIVRPLEYFERMYDCMGSENMKILTAYYNEKPISATILVHYGNKTSYLYGASSNEYRNFMPNYLLQWEMIKIAIKNRSVLYDLRGVEGKADNSNGLYRFKKGFGADYIELIGEVNYAFKTLTYKLYRFSEKTYRNIRSTKAKIQRKFSKNN